MDKNTKAVCYLCGFDTIDINASSNPGTVVSTCSNPQCGLQTKQTNHSSGGIDHQELYPYELEKGKSEAQLIQEYNASIQSKTNSNTLRVGTFNNWNYNQKKSDSIKKAMRMILENQIGICGLQEFTKYSDFDGVGLSKVNGAFTNVATYLPIEGSNGRFAGNAITSHYPFIATDGGSFNVWREQRQCYVYAKININGKTVSVYNTHPYYNGEGIVKEQLLELRQIINADNSDYIVITGDFNSRDLETYRLLMVGGYKKEEWKDDKLEISFPVRPDGYRQLKCVFDVESYADDNKDQAGKTTIDNILVTENVRASSATRVRTPFWVTDHDLLFADLTLL